MVECNFLRVGELLVLDNVVLRVEVVGGRRKGSIFKYSGGERKAHPNKVYEGVTASDSFLSSAEI